ncbi:MAG: hypothetical protein IJF75_07075 [Clostridia bacterium]|nr:hypothetical protein [Clostridia bacterium]
MGAKIGALLSKFGQWIFANPVKFLIVLGLTVAGVFAISLIIKFIKWTFKR